MVMYLVIFSFALLLTMATASEDCPLLNLGYRRNQALSPSTPQFNILRGPPPPPPTTMSTFDPIFGITDNKKPREADDVAGRFTTKTTTIKRRRKTTPPRISLQQDCDYLAYYCLKAYDTGKVCGRMMFHGYQTFKNYCMLDYVNCMTGYQAWQVIHMGTCFEMPLMTEYRNYPYRDDNFLDDYYVVDIM